MSYRNILIALCVVGVFMGIGAGLYVNNERSYQNVTIQGPKDTSAKIYINTSGDAPFSFSNDAIPVAEVKEKGSFRLKNGRYYVVLDDPSKKFDQRVTDISIQKGIDEYTYSGTLKATELARLATAENAPIAQAINAKYPSLKDSYTLRNVTLYQLGEWAGAVIQPKTPDLDTLKVILKKEGKGWTLQTVPQISIGKPAHKQIPEAVIDAVNDIP